MNRPLTLATALALPLLATACNSSSSPSAQKSSSPIASPTMPAPAATSPAAAGATDKQRADAIQLTAADLPTGWKFEKVTTTAAQQRKDDAEFDACLGQPTIEAIETASSEQDYGRADGFAFAGSLINVTKSEAQAQPYLTALEGPKGIPCSVASARRQPPPKGATIANVTGSKLAAPAGAVGIRVVVTYKFSNGRQIPVTIDDFGMAVKRFIVQVDFSGVIQPPQQALESSVTAKVFARAAVNAA